MSDERKLVDDGSGWGTCLECGDQCLLWEGICASGCDIKPNTSNSTRDETAFMFDDDGSITAIARLPKVLTDAISEFEDSVGTVINILDSTHNENIGQTLSDAADRFNEVYWRFQCLPDLSGLTSLSDAAAESLSKHEGDLWLNGLTELSDAAAESLSKHEGYLMLVGLTELSDAAAESLSEHGGNLRLASLTKLSDTAAQSLAKKEPKFGSTSLNLENLPASAAKILRDAGHGV